MGFSSFLVQIKCLSAYSTLNEASITGESMPVEKTLGDEVFAGTINGNGVLKLKVHQPPESSLIQRVIRLVEQAQTQTPPSQQFVERFEKLYARIIVLTLIHHSEKNRRACVVSAYGKSSFRPSLTKEG